VSLDVETLRTWLQILSVVLIPIGSVVYTWIATRDKDNSQHIKAVESALGTRIAEQLARLQDHATRIDRLEGEIKHVPNNSEFGELLSDLRAMQATQDAAHREMHGMRLAINRIEDFLLKK
jgi:hypothetical protein